MKIPTMLLLIACSYAHTADFTIGVYSPEPKNEATILNVKNAGFNTLLSYQSSRQEIDKLLALALKYEMKVFITFDRKLIVAGDVEAVRETVRHYKSHPALAAWYLYDEPAKDITPARLSPFYRMLKEETPDIPVAIVNCWDETWDQYGDVLDLQMVDMYPVNDEPFPAAPLQYLTTFVRQAVATGKPVIPVIQTVNWKSFEKLLKNKKVDVEKLRYPNTAELRYMAFGSMTYGVQGVFGYAYYHAARLDPQWWENECAAAFSELNQFVSMVKNPASPHIFKRPADGNYRVALWDDAYLVMVNDWPLERKRAWTWADGYFKKDYDLIPWGNTRNVKAAIVNSKIQVDGAVEPWEVFIWKLQEK